MHVEKLTWLLCEKREWIKNVDKEVDAAVHQEMMMQVGEPERRRGGTRELCRR